MEVKICDICKGTGKIVTEVGYHNTTYETHICSNCNGTGRIKTRTYRYCVPFDKDELEIYKIDYEIINLIRKLEDKGVKKQGKSKV